MACASQARRAKNAINIIVSFMSFSGFLRIVLQLLINSSTFGNTFFMVEFLSFFGALLSLIESFLPRVIGIFEFKVSPIWLKYIMLYLFW